MNQKNLLQRTPQFLQFISQFQSQQQGDYAQIFITKSPNSSFVSTSQGGYENGNSVSSQNSDSSSFASNSNKGQSSSSNGKKSSSYQNSNEQIQSQWMKKVDNLNKQTEQLNQQNLLKRGKQCVQVDAHLEDIPNQSWKDYQEMQKQQIIIEEGANNNSDKQKETGNLSDNQKQQKQGKKNKNGGYYPAKPAETSDQLRERLTLHEQYMLLPKNERNKALLGQKKRDERWDKQPITHKQVSHFSSSQTETDKKKAVEEILVQQQIKQQLKQAKKVQAPTIEKEKVELFDNIIQQLKESGEAKTKKERRQVKEDLISEMLIEKESSKNRKSKKESKGEETSSSALEQGEGIQNGTKRHREKRKNKNDGENVQTNDDDLINDLDAEKKQSSKYQKSKKNEQNAIQVTASNKLADFLDNELINTYKKNMKREEKQAKLDKKQNNKQNDYKLEEEILRQDRFQNKNGFKKNKNKQFQSFEPYWSSQEINKAIKEKKAFKGVYTANEKNQQLGRLKCDEIEGLVFVNSHKDQNRALHNCVVGFVIVSGDPTSRLQNIEGSTEQSLKKLQSENLMIEEPLDKSLEQEMEENDEDWETDSEDGDDIPVNTGKIVAKVVHIFENPYKNDKIVGYLQELQEPNQKKSAQSGKKKYWFVPKFSKLPKMIPVEFTDEFQHQVEENDVDITKTYVVGSIREWGEDSYYPLATISECLGARGDIEVECDTLLKEFSVYNQDFTPATEEYLTKFRNQLNDNGEYIIPQSEKNIRWDLTNDIICTIDPHDAKDLDDALSVKHLRDDIYEIGVHIADVSHFVQPDTPLDEDARLRTTSVYLVHRVIPMLPRLLCENLCSLNPYVERLAFTVFFQMKESGEVLWDAPMRIGKSIIKSCNKFSYDTVQLMIEKKIKTPEELPEHNQTREGVDKQKMFDSILLLTKLGMKRREKRMEAGVLSIESVKKRFKLDDKLWPVDYSLEERKDAMFVVEEFMLLANQIIGKQMVKDCKSIAVLRQHAYPSDRKQQQLNIIAKKFGHVVDFSSLQAINESIERLKKDTKLSFEKKLFLKKQMFLVLEQAQYFVADQLPANEWRHFALNFDVYTHFTSPIRRYPDLLVHRVMYSILQNKQDQIDRNSLLSIMDLCNDNKTKAKQVSDNCQKIFMCLYLKNHCVESKAMVVSFGATSLTIFIPDHEIQRTIYFQDYKSIIKTKVEKEKEGNKLIIIYKTPKMAKSNTVAFNEFSPIIASLTSTDTFPIDYKVKLTLPDPEDKKITHIIE